MNTMLYVVLLLNNILVGVGLRLNMEQWSGGPGAEPKSHRVAWFHVPKCGTSFGTALAHYANSSLPPQAQMQLQECKGPPGKCFTNKYPIEAYFKGLLWEKDGNWGDHYAIDNKTFNKFHGHFFGMIRKPSDRSFSSWRFFAPHSDVKEYSERIKGVTTKMLAGQAYGLECHNEQAVCRKQEPNVDLALDRLDGFKFVGLTEKWDLSICLFHKMFGGKCSQMEFANMRPTKPGKEKPVNLFENIIDPYDDKVHAKASEIFEQNMLKYGVTRDVCERQICPDVTGVFTPTHTNADGDARFSVDSYKFDWPGRLEYDDQYDDQ